ncbi:MAG: tetratricopeptide repeat protein [Pedosphaera sp.]|nr:tetratricopeptide repeat protein [Pedosphaera sp.]
MIRPAVLILGLLLTGCLLPGRTALGQPAETEEQLAFKAAARAMEDGNYERAMNEFREYGKKFPESARIADAAERAWLSEAELALERTNLGVAAKLFESFPGKFPQSERKGIATVGSSETARRAGQLARAKELLMAEKGGFQVALAAGQPPGVLLRGLLLLSELEAEQREYAAAEVYLRQATNYVQGPTDAWRRLGVQFNARSDAANWAGARDTARLLRDLGTNEILVAHRPEATAMLGRALTALGENDEAIRVWQENLAVGLPVVLRTEAASRLAEIQISLGQLTPARETLEAYLRENLSDAGAAGVRLQLARVLLQQALTMTNAGGGLSTPGLVQIVRASGLFERVATNGGPAILTGAAWLGKGWCRWEEYGAGGGTNRLEDAGAAFLRAASQLPFSRDQQTAFFKLADVQLAIGQSSLAFTNYERVAGGYSNVSGLDPVLEQSARLQAAVSAADCGFQGPASTWLRRWVTHEPPDSDLARGILLVTQTLEKRQLRADARAVLQQEMLESGRSITIKPVLQLALASSYQRDEEWDRALTVLSDWLARFTTNESAPQVAVERALTAERAGRLTNAVAMFAELATLYPTNSHALLAQLWLGDHYYARQEFQKAEVAYLVVLTNSSWRGRPNWHHARLLAARSALEQRTPAGLANARGYLTNLLSDLSCPTNLLAQGYVALGDLLRREPPALEADGLQNFREAIIAYSKVPSMDNTGELALAAWGAVGDCHLTLAAKYPNSYGAASEAYRKVADAPNSGVTVRSRARVGLGIVAQKQGQREPALGHFQDVFYGKILRPGEVLDPFWLRTSGQAAAKLLEEMERWETASRVYERLAIQLPSDRVVFDAEVARCRELINKTRPE